MDRCWARELGDCGGGISREHLLSACIFPDKKVTIQGFSWCLEKPKEIGLESFVGKVLCRNHNSRLSVLDAEAGAAATRWQELGRLEDVRNAMPARRWRVVRHRLDISLIERWCAKSTINLAYAGTPTITWHPGGEPISIPPLPIVRAVFGLAPFPEHMGLYHVSNKTPVPQGAPLSISQICWEETAALAGATFVMWNLRFFMSLHNDPMPPHPPFIKRLPEEWHRSLVHRGIQRVNQENRGHLSQVMFFDRTDASP